MKKNAILAILTILMFNISALAQSNSYNMVIEMANGTKINVGPNDVRNIFFTDGQLTVSGESIDNIKKEIASLKEKNNILQMQIETLTNEIAKLKNESDRENNQGQVGKKKMIITAELVYTGNLDNKAIEIINSYCKPYNYKTDYNDNYIDVFVYCTSSLHSEILRALFNKYGTSHSEFEYKLAFYARDEYGSILLTEVIYQTNGKYVFEKSWE